MVVHTVYSILLFPLLIFFSLLCGLLVSLRLLQGTPCFLERFSLISKGLVSHYSAIGDTISCDAPQKRDLLQRQVFSAMPPLLGLSWIAIGHRKEVGV